MNLTKSSLKDHLSPGSVLEASFSSSSLDDSSGRLLKLFGFRMQIRKIFNHHGDNIVFLNN